MKTLILNGWAASSAAWDRCRSARDGEILSYVECLDGADRRRLQENSAAGERTLLVGWSMGASRALGLACDFPDDIAALVLVAGTPRMMEDPSTLWRGMNERRLAALMKGLELTSGQGFFGVPEGCRSPYCMDGRENLERGLRYLRETDLRPALERTFRGAPPRFPVTIIHGERDPVVRPENASYLAGLFEGAELVRLPIGEHALPVFAAAEIDAAIARITEFLL